MKTIQDAIKKAVEIGFPEDRALDEITDFCTSQEVSVPEQNPESCGIPDDIYEKVIDGLYMEYDAYLDALSEVSRA